MRIIPVLDLLGSLVVRGVAGQRDQYRPLQSKLVEGSEPLAVAKAIRAEFGLTELYVADLDAILHRRANLALLKTLVDDRFCLLVDAGIRRCDDAAPILGLGVERLVVGLETLESPHELEQLVQRYGSEWIVFSLDLRDGKALASEAGWGTDDPFEISRRVIDAGCTQLIVLDIARVGTGGGVPTLDLCDQIRRAFPAVTILTGGGVRGIEDLQTLDRAGVDGVLIASALHDSSITRCDLDTFGERPA
jgi:phosphoribosylformimino-5-aminoimidazole carboxamide ribotide isomerase